MHFIKWWNRFYEDSVHCSQFFLVYSMVNCLDPMLEVQYLWRLLRLFLTRRLYLTYKSRWRPSKIKTNLQREGIIIWTFIPTAPSSSSWKIKPLFSDGAPCLSLYSYCHFSIKSFNKNLWNGFVWTFSAFVFSINKIAPPTPQNIVDPQRFQ